MQEGISKKMKSGQTDIRKYYKTKIAASDKKSIHKKFRHRENPKFIQQILRKFLLTENQHKTQVLDISRAHTQVMKKYIQLDIRELFTPIQHCLLVNR